ncbi:MAG TPA: tRNA pseudouridine(55) synthase TruB [Oleiagrimonas sp.]|nr:tRNA pseudouridine(55) synthase TruB [Oleiagrimonas sp.]
MARIPKRPVHGILLLDKPRGLSSNEALQACRRVFRAAKGGHTGSLDPMATGMLPLCFGEATKIAGLLLGSCKAYEAECLLGVTTNTDDAEGEATVMRPVPDLDDEALREALQQFVGHIEQVPPAHSALKRDGVRMYERARRGETVEIQPRGVDVHAIDWLGRDGPRLRFRVTCGSGTYIRSLARDLGEKLGCGAHLTALRRQWVDPFHEPVMVTLDALQALSGRFNQLDRLLLPVDAGLAELPAACLDEAQSVALQHGQPVQPASELAPGRCRAYAADGRLLALAEVRGDRRLHVVRGFHLPTPAASANP